MLEQLIELKCSGSQEPALDATALEAVPPVDVTVVCNKSTYLSVFVGQSVTCVLCVLFAVTGVSIREELSSRKFCCSGSGLSDYVQYPFNIISF